MGAQGSKASRAAPAASAEVTVPSRPRLCSFRRGASKKQRDAGRAASPLSDGSSNSVASHAGQGPARARGAAPPREPPRSVPPRPVPPQLGRSTGQKSSSPTAEMKTPTARKTSSRRGVAAASQKATPLRDHYRLAPSGGDTGATPLKQLATEPTKVAPPRSIAPSAAVAAAAANSPVAPTAAVATPTMTPAPAATCTLEPATDIPSSPVVLAPSAQSVDKLLPAAPEGQAAPAQVAKSVQQEQSQPLELPVSEQKAGAEAAAAAALPHPQPHSQPSSPPLQQQQQQQQQQQHQQEKEQQDDALAAALQSRFKHFTVGFDALAVVLQHTLNTVEQLTKDEKHADYEMMKNEWRNNKTLIDEMKVEICNLECALEKNTTTLHQLSQQEEELKKQNGDLLQQKLELEHETTAITAALEKKCQMQVELVNSQYAAEQTTLQALHTERENNLIQDFNLKEEKSRQNHEANIAQIRQDFLQKEHHFKLEILQLKEDCERVKKQLAIFSEADNKDSRLQASITRCGELEEEVRSLQSVLELRHQELQDLRKNNGSLLRQAEQLPSALQRVTALEARVEDLQAQLKEKSDVERQAAQQQCALLEALQKEVNQKNRLTLLTEELQWKLKQNAEVFSALVAMNGTSSNMQVPSTSGASSPAVSRRNTNGSLHSISESASPAKADCEISRLSVSLMKRVNNSSHQSLRPDIEDEVSSPPPSPKIKGIVEKIDSVSWVLDMEESSEELVSRLVRRAGSFRGTTPPPSSSGPHPQSLPATKRRYKSGSLSLSSSSSSVFRRSHSKNDNAMSSSEKDRDGTEHYGAARSRSHSVSADSVDSVDMINWGLNIVDSYNKVPENNHEIHSQDNKLLISVKNAGGKSFMPHTIHSELDMVLTNNLSSELQKHVSENGKQNWNCNMPDFSNDESPTKSSGSSAYTSSDEDVRNNIDGKNIPADENYCRNEKSSHLQNVLPFNALNICGSPNTADLSLLAACAAAQPALMPKDAAGEAMISEETSEDENDRDEVDDQDETVSSSITRSASENEEEEDEDDHFINI